MSKTIILTDEQYEALQRGESITISPPKKKKWKPEGGEFCITINGDVILSNNDVVEAASSADPLEFGMEYPTRELAKRAASMMRPIHRYIAYAMEHWPDYEVPEPGSRTYFVSFNSALGIWVTANNLSWRLPWIPYGPEDKVRELVDKLNSGEVKF